MATGSGTGTPASAPGTTTAAQLIAAIRPALGDEAAAVWPDAELLGYLNEGLREYSLHVPRRAEATIATVAGERRYALPDDWLDVISVECPAGNTPASRLHRLGHTHPRFGGRVYDILARGDAATPPALLLGADPEPGATIVVAYLAAHAPAATLASAVSVPAAHHHVLLHYVLYAAARRLQQREQASPTSSSSLLMAQLAGNTRRLELTYLNALNRILTERRGEAAVVVW